MPRDLGIAARLRRDGIPTIETNGWETRGDSTFFPRGSVNHHTAGATRSAGIFPSLGVLINGRSDLPGPLCQVGLGYDNKAYVVASGRANHAGIPDGGSWRGMTGNTTAWGLEIEHPGTFPLEVERYEMAARIHAALIRGTTNEERVGQHFEWAPSRKIDLATGVSPNHFRSRVAHYLANPGSIVPPQERVVWRHHLLLGGAGVPKYIVRVSGGDLYAVYNSGLARRVRAEEVDYLKDVLNVPIIDSADSGTKIRFEQMDEALRGFVQEREV